MVSRNPFQIDALSNSFASFALIELSLLMAKLSHARDFMSLIPLRYSLKDLAL